MVAPPHIYMARDAVVYGNWPNACVTMGAQIQVPDLTFAHDGLLESYYDALRQWLGQLPSGIYYDWSFQARGVFPPSLKEYHARRDSLTSAPVRHVRDRKFSAFEAAHATHSLRSETTLLYLTVKADRKRGITRKREILGSLRTACTRLEPHFDLLDSQLSQFGGAAVRLTRRELVANLAYTFDPETNPFEMESERAEDLAQSDLLPQLYPGDLGFLPGGTAFVGGNYHRTLVLSQMPTASLPHFTAPLMGLPFTNYRLSLKGHAVDARQALQHLQTQEKKFQAANTEQGDDASNRADLESIQEAIIAIKERGEPVLSTQLCIHTWAPTPESLSHQVAEIKSAGSHLEGAVLYEPPVKSTTGNLLWSLLPGYWSPYDNFHFRCQPSLVAKLIPTGSTFAGDARTADLIYANAKGGVVGLPVFVSGSPVMQLVFGSMGSGKSVQCISQLLQIGDRNLLDYGLIIDVGSSWSPAVRLLGGRTISITPDSPHRINPFETGGTPLFPSHLASLIEDILCMADVSHEHERVNAYRAAVQSLAETVLDSALDEYFEQNPESLAKARSLAYQHHLHAESLQGEELDAIDRFLSFETYAETEEAVAARIGFDDAEVFDYMAEPRFSTEARRFLFSCLPQESFPLLSQFVRAAETYKLPDVDEELLRDLAQRLKPWCGGANGNLLNGHTNLRFDGWLQCVELEALHDSPALKRVVSRILYSRGVRHAMRLPRHLRKLLVLEEAPEIISTLDRGAETVESLFRTARKYTIAIWAIVQDYNAWQQCSARTAVMNGSDLVLVMRQKDSQDVDNLARDIQLPDNAKAAILAYQKPDKMPEPKYGSCLAYFRDSGECGTVINQADPYVLTVAESSGASHAEKEAFFREGSPDELHSALLSQLEV